MTRRQESVAALLRWRAFGESKARERFGSASAVARAALASAEAADARLTALSNRRRDLLSADALDLARLQTIADFERMAEHISIECHQSADSARDAMEQAQADYLHARTATRSIETRHRRMATAAADQAEKRAFDQISDLLVQTKGTRR